MLQYHLQFDEKFHAKIEILCFFSFYYNISLRLRSFFYPKVNIYLLFTYSAITKLIFKNSIFECKERACSLFLSLSFVKFFHSCSLFSFSVSFFFFAIPLLTLRRRKHFKMMRTSGNHVKTNDASLICNFDECCSYRNFHIIDK